MRLVCAAGSTATYKNPDAWTCSNSQGFHINTWSVEGNEGNDPSGMTTPFIENWVASGSLLGDGTIAHPTITNLVPGIYQVAGLMRVYSQSGNDPSGVSIYANDASKDILANGTQFTYNGMKGVYAQMSVTTRVGDDGVLNVGYTIKDATFNWLSFKNFTLTYLGDKVPDDEVNALLATVPTDPMNATVKSALDAAVAALNSDKSYDNYNALVDAISDANASVKKYQVIKAALDAADAATLDEVGQAAYNANADITALKTGYNERTLVELTAENQTSIANALATAAKAQTTDGADMTLAIINHSFETGDLTGWTTTTSGDTGVKPNSNNIYKITNADGDYLFNTWNGDATGYNITQTLTEMPSGKYKLKALIAGYVGGKVDLIANDSKTTNTNTATGTADEVEVEFTALNGTITVGAGNADHWYKVDNFRLTFVEAIALAGEDDYTALNNAITAAKNNTLGFENGEYAPYNNLVALEALAAAKAIDQTALNAKAEVTAATTALGGATWTANEGEVNAFAYGDFSTYETINGEDMPYGWNLYNGASNHSRIMGGTEGSSNAGLSASTSRKALLLKFNGTYGETTGYTMPLKAGKIYKITFKYGGWSNTPNTVVSLTDPSDAAITLAPNFKPATNDAYSDNTHWYDYTGYFVSTTAGDYKLNFTKVESGQQQIVIADIDLRTASALAFADGSVPTYAPGTYPSVKITRTLNEGKWATAVYPFAVNGVDGLTIANLSGYSDGTLGFTTTAAASTANVPFLMKFTSDKNEISLSNVAVNAAADSPITTVDDVASLKGTYTKTTIDAGEGVYNYVLSSNTIYKVGSNSATINPYRAYIQLTQPTKARALTFFIDGEATAIEGITAGGSMPGKVYNLNGQQVEKAQKGLYIVNGRKVVVK